MLQDYQTKPPVYYFSFRVRGSFTKPLNPADFIKNILTNKTFLVMKNSFLFNFRNTLNNLLSKQILVIALLLGISSQLDLLHAQAKLSIQGILKKASGEAVPDGTYNLIFNLYTVENLGTPLWTETQMGVDVISGIYSTVLGNTTPLTAAFDVDYYLGVKVGTQQSTEMLPRIQLTSAPYALAIRGENNKFPSSGQVITDSLEVNGNVLTQNGAPGPNGLNTTGYGFL